MQTHKEAHSAWLGRVYVLANTGTQTQQYSATVAVWAKDRHHFDTQLHTHIASGHLQLEYSEEVMPALKWLAQNPADQPSIELARSVHASWPIVFSPLKKIDTNAVVLQHPDQTDYVRVETLGNIEPLGSQASVWPLENVKTVPEILQEPIFGQVPPTDIEIAQYGNVDAVAPLKTYAVLCAAAVLYLRDQLRDSGLTWRCLFQGEREQALKDSAPHLVELKENNAFTRRLFTHVPNFADSHTTVHLWQKRAGIYIRSRASFKELLQHLRKFPRLENEHGKGYFFRFWDPLTLRMANIQRHDPAAPITRLCDRRMVHSLYGFSDISNLCIRPNAALPRANGTLQLRPTDFEVLADLREGEHLAAVTAALATQHPDLHAFSHSKDILALYTQGQQKHYTSEAASWNYIRSALRLEQLNVQQATYHSHTATSLSTAEEIVDPHQEYSPTKRAERLWEWINTHASKEAPYYDPV